MDRAVTFRELVELKGWMTTTFAAKKEFRPLQDGMLKVEGRVSNFEDKTLRSFDKVFGWLEKLEQEHLFTNHGMVRLEENMEDLKGKVGILEGKMGALEGKMGAFEGKLINIEKILGNIQTKLAS